MIWRQCTEPADNGGYGEKYIAHPGVLIRRKVHEENDDPHSHTCPTCAHTWEHNSAEMYACPVKGITKELKWPEIAGSRGDKREEMHTCPKCGTAEVFKRREFWDGKWHEFEEEES